MCCDDIVVRHDCSRDRWPTASAVVKCSDGGSDEGSVEDSVEGSVEGSDEGSVEVVIVSREGKWRQNHAENGTRGHAVIYVENLTFSKLFTNFYRTVFRIFPQFFVEIISNSIKIYVY